jgi:hypothetical protein
VPDTADEEVEIVRRRVESRGRALELLTEPPALEEIRRIVTIFRELRDGKTTDGKTKLKSPSGTLSPADDVALVEKFARIDRTMGGSAEDRRRWAALLAGAGTGARQH